MGAFEYRQAEEIRDTLARHGVRYLFIGKSGAIILGYPDTTQDADLFPERSPENGRALARGLLELGFALSPVEVAEIERGKDFIQLKHGPFDVDLASRPMASNGFRTRGAEEWWWTGSPYAIWTTSSRARRPRTVPKTANPSIACAASGSTGCGLAGRVDLIRLAVPLQQDPGPAGRRVQDCGTYGFRWAGSRPVASASAAACWKARRTSLASLLGKLERCTMST
jgi:hypothetical protein